MQTDVKSKYMNATGASSVGLPRARIKAVYYMPTGTAGSVSFKSGGSGGTELLKVDTPASATQPCMMLIPGQGVLFEADPYVTLTNVTSVTFFYG
jgi:hypothetical protein